MDCLLCLEPLPAPDDPGQRLFRSLEKSSLKEQLFGGVSFESPKCSCEVGKGRGEREQVGVWETD